MEAAELRVTDQRIWLNGLPEAFRGLRIVQISDIHHSLFFPLDCVAAVVELANRLKPDLVALTGDFVTYSRRSIGPVAEMLGRFGRGWASSRCWAITIFAWMRSIVQRALRRQRIEVLRNRHMMLRDGGEALPVAGVDDLWLRRGSASGAARHSGRPPTILLAHNPRLVARAARHDVSLVLSGHTHGGQVNLPLLGTVYGRSPEQLRFKIGWDRLGATQIYVSRGIGTIVLPWRLRCPAEIPCLELQPHHATDSGFAGTFADSFIGSEPRTPTL